MSNFSIAAKLESMGYNLDALDDGMEIAFMSEVARIAQSAQAEWVRLAQSRLHTSRDIYLQGLNQADSLKVSSDGKTFELQLVGQMANNFEFGMPSFDMKTVRPGWLGGGKTKTAKDGSKYMIIPFRHSTSSSTRLDYTGKAKAAGLKEQLRSAVKAYGLDRMVRNGAGDVVPGPVARIPGGAPVHPYLQGLTRTQIPQAGRTKAGQRGSSQLTTWRVISDKSDPGAWIHPGLEAANLLPEVGRFIDGEMGRIIESILGT